MDTIAPAAHCSPPPANEVSGGEGVGGPCHCINLEAPPTPTLPTARKRSRGEGARRAWCTLVPNNSGSSRHKISLLDCPHIELHHRRRDAERQARFRLVIGVDARAPVRHAHLRRRI